MATVIVGSARSGTSMVARMLNVCGLYLGRSEELPAGDEANPSGSWEHFGFLPINANLIRFLDGPIEDIKPLPRGWEFDPALDEFYDQAREMIDRSFAGHDNWGWKQPACALTLPFWKRLIPDLKVIDCIRNPLDCASSIRNSHDVQREYALVIWQYYHLTALTDTVPAERFLTHYEGYFPDFKPALYPILDFVGLERPADGSETEAQIRSFHNPGLKHYNSRVEELMADASVSEVVKELYRELLTTPADGSGLPILETAKEFLPVIRQASRVTAIGSDVLSAITTFDKLRMHRDELIEECARVHLKRKEDTATFLADIDNCNQVIQKSKAEAEQLIAEIAHCNNVIKEREDRIAHLEQILASRTHQIATRICDIRNKMSGRQSQSEQISGVNRKSRRVGAG